MMSMVEVLNLPGMTNGTRWIGEQDFALQLHLPLLLLLVEFDVGGAVDLQHANRRQVDQFAVKTTGLPIWSNSDDEGVHWPSFWID